MRLLPRRAGILRREKEAVSAERYLRNKGRYSQNPNLKRYIASVGWSDTGVYAGGSAEPVACSYEGSASASSTGVGG